MRRLLATLLTLALFANGAGIALQLHVATAHGEPEASCCPGHTDCHDPESGDEQQPVDDHRDCMQCDSLKSQTAALTLFVTPAPATPVTNRRTVNASLCSSLPILAARPRGPPISGC